jgi:hypothetical protein
VLEVCCPRPQDGRSTLHANFEYQLMGRGLSGANRQAIEASCVP